MIRQASLQLETLVRRALGGVERGAMLVADADLIEKGGAFAAIVAALAPFYAGASSEKKEKINQFLKKYSVLHEHSSASSYEENVYAATIELRRLLGKELGIRLENIK
jgi:calcineurin-like phosphoesterase